MQDFWKRFPVPPVCLGIRLQPLSLGHLFALNEADSPYLADRSATKAELALACLVCAEPSASASKVIGSRWIWLALAFIWFRHWDWQAESDKFTGYLNAGREWPRVREYPASNGDGAPQHWSALASFISAGFSHDEAMTLPIAHLNRLVAAGAHDKGIVKLWTDRDQEFWDACHAEDMARVKARKN